MKKVYSKSYLVLMVFIFCLSAGTLNEVSAQGKNSKRASKTTSKTPTTKKSAKPAKSPAPITKEITAWAKRTIIAMQTIENEMDKIAWTREYELLGEAGASLSFNSAVYLKIDDIFVTVIRFKHPIKPTEYSIVYGLCNEAQIRMEERFRESGSNGKIIDVRNPKIGRYERAKQNTAGWNIMTVFCKQEEKVEGLF